MEESESTYPRWSLFYWWKISSWRKFDPLLISHFSHYQHAYSEIFSSEAFMKVWLQGDSQDLSWLVATCKLTKATPGEGLFPFSWKDYPKYHRAKVFWGDRVPKYFWSIWLLRWGFKAFWETCSHKSVSCGRFLAYVHFKMVESHRKENR